MGVEYDYWKHKYGIDNDSPLGDEDLGGTNQSAISLLVKAHFQAVVGPCRLRDGDKATHAPFDGS